MNRRRARTHWLAGLGVSAIVVVGALALGSATPGTNTAGRAAAQVGTNSHQIARALSKTALAAEITRMYKSSAAAYKSPAAMRALEDAPGMPTCAAPQIPSPTYPPGHSYGIPFLAAITNGELLAGYDEWTANNNVWTVGKHTYHLYPWQSKIFDITGWVTGLLELPSLSAQIPPQDVVFCDQGGSNCLSAAPPAGQCIQLSTQFAPDPGVKTPPDPITNIPGGGSPCTQNPDKTPRCPCSKTPACLPFVLSLTPQGPTTLTVTGVAPDGALELSVTTSAVTTANLLVSTCQNLATTVTLSTQVPTSLPPTAPVTPNPPNTDYRGDQTTPTDLTGPLSSGSTTMVGNDFAIPAFIPGQPTSACSGTVTDLLNTYAGGWGLGFGGGNGQGEGLYYQDGGTSPTVAYPGWAQFSVTTTVVSLDLPTGPPPNFDF
jgi:hypothetical protein